MAESAHSSLVTTNLHVPGYRQDSDPGAVGPGKYWVDSSGGTGAWTLKVRNAADSGWEEIASGGGGGGAPDTAPYVTTAADGGLSAEKVLPWLANYDPRKAPASPSATDDEFDDDSIHADWTLAGTADTLVENRYHGYLYIEDNDNAFCGVYKTYSPGAATLTVVAGLGGYNLGATSGYISLVLADSAGTSFAEMGISRTAGSLLQARTGPAGGTLVPLFAPFFGSCFYLMIQRDATTNYACKVSFDGMVWHTVATFSQAGTVGRVYLGTTSQSSVANFGTFDFIRMFTSQTEVIGAAP